jgi:hypothetical protein
MLVTVRHQVNWEQSSAPAKPLSAPLADATPATTAFNEEATKPSTVMQEKHTSADFLAPAVS